MVVYCCRILILMVEIYSRVFAEQLILFYSHYINTTSAAPVCLKIFAILLNQRIVYLSHHITKAATMTKFNKLNE